MENVKLTVRLPKRDIEFAKKYAQEHRITVTELIDRYFRRLQDAGSRTIHPEVERMSGLIPSDVDSKALHHEHVANRHKR